MIELAISPLSGHAGTRPPGDLVRSMQDQGFLPVFPIVVTPETNGVYQILDGRRRTAAAEKAGLESVLAVVTEASAALTILTHATRAGDGLRALATGHVRGGLRCACNQNSPDHPGRTPPG